MKLIIESGATKADWTLIEKGGVKSAFRTDGLNFSSGDEDFLHRTLEYATVKVSDIADSEIIDSIIVYAAGLFPSEDEQSPFAFLGRFFSCRFPEAEIELNNDLLAAARALHGVHSGIACILGTGSNTCVYDGEKIVRRIPSGGFILGDEGSASALGRRFIEDYIKGLVPECVALAFDEKYDLEYPSIVDQVYHGASPAAYLGKFAPDILAFYNKNSYMTALVEDNFRRFFERCLLPCIGAVSNACGLAVQLERRECAIGIAGAFGFACREIIDSVAAEYDIEISNYLPSPSKSLIEYHSR